MSEDRKPLFEELELARRWRLRREEMRPVRVEREPSWPEDPLAPRDAAAETPASTAGDAPPRPWRLIRRALDAFGAARAAVRASRGNAPPAEPDSVDPGAVPPEPGADAWAGVVAFVGAVPRCGTTGALVAWALAQAEGGARAAVVDAAVDRPALPLALREAVAVGGWDREREPSPRRLARLAHPVPGRPNLLLLPLSWDPARIPMDAASVAGRLSALTRAAELAGANTVALDLGSFPALPGGVPDPRLRWAARHCDIVSVVTVLDVISLDAAARLLVALDQLGARRRVLLVAGGARPEEAASAARLLAELTPPAPCDSCLALPWPAGAAWSADGGTTRRLPSLFGGTAPARPGRHTTARSGGEAS